MNRIHTIIIFLVVFGLLHPKAQEPVIVFENFHESSGMPVQRTLEIHQDRDGVMWFGGFDGLSRYDGYSVELFRSRMECKELLSGNNISSIAEDNTGRLWIGTINTGMNISNVEKDSFYSLDPLMGHSKNLISTSIYDVKADDKGRMWIVGDDGLHIITVNNDSFAILDLSEFLGKPINGIDTLKPKVLYFDHRNRMWIGCEKGIMVINIDARSIQRPDINLELPSDEIDDICADQNGTIWFSRQSPRSRLIYYQESDSTFQMFTGIPFQSDTRRTLFCFDKDNRIWAATFGEQLYGYDLRDSSLFLASHLNSNILNDRFIRKPFCDKYGNIWIPGDGIIKYDYSRGFNNYSHPLSFQQSNTLIYHHDDLTWMGWRELGLQVYNQNTEEYTYYGTKEKGIYHLPTNHIRSVLKLSNGNIGIVGFANYTILDLSKRTSRSFELSGTSRGILESKSKDVFIGGYDGLIKFNLEGDYITTYTLPPLNDEKRNFINSIQEDKSGNIWFSSNGMGVARLNTETEQITQFIPEPGQNNMPTAFIFDLLIDGDSLWIGSDMGLVHFDLRTETFTPLQFGTENTNDHVCAILKSGSELWISTLDGLVSYDIISGQVSRFNPSDGLLNNVYYDGSKDQHNGYLYFGGKNGIDFFKPSELRSKYHKPVVRLFSFKINNSITITPDSFKAMERLVLPHNSKVIEIEFGATRFLSQENVEYAYRIPGYLKSWQKTGTQRRLLLTDLKPGEYDIEIKARSLFGEWSNEHLLLPIEIETPWWKTIWFQFAIILVLIAIVGLVMYFREKHVKNKEIKDSQIKQRILRLEKLALLAQMNPHFIFNSMNAIQQFITKGENEQALRYMSKFSRLLRKVLNISAREKSTLDEETGLIETYLEVEKMRYPKRFSYQMHIAEELNDHSIRIPPFLIQPYIEQAVHNSLLNSADHAHVKISMARANGYIRLLIEDNGVDTSYEKQQQSFDGGVMGTTIVEQRLKHINHTISDQEVRKEKLYDFENRPIGNRVELLINIE